MIVDTDTETDLALITRIQAYDETAIEDLYTAYVQKLYTFFYYRLYDTSSCEDLLSETRMHIFSKIHTFDTTKSTNVSGWIYSIANHKLIDYFRKKKPNYGMTEYEEMFSYDDRILEKTDAKHLVEKLSQALQAFHPQAKDIVLMKLREGLSHSEIAEALLIKESNSRKIFSRSIKHLQELHGESILTLCITSLILASHAQ